MVTASKRNHTGFRATHPRVLAFVLLTLANVLWAGNWVMGRALRGAFEPIGLNFWRWVVAAAVLAPFALFGVVRKRAVIRRHAGILLLLAFTGVALYQCLVYLGLRSTTAVNAVLLNSSTPLFVLLCSWAIEHERTTRRQIVGVLISLVGILVILSRGDLGNLLKLEFHVGDAWILLAMPIWGVYSVLLKRRPPELGGLELMFVIAAAGVLMLTPFYAIEALQTAPDFPTPAAIAGVLYIGIGAAVFAFVFWNLGVSIVGANAAGFTLHLLPAFGTVFAIIFLGESFGVFHAVGIATILIGVVLATRQTRTS
ncbi:MAG: DMT family transporter [Sulfurifustis sp.]